MPEPNSAPTTSLDYFTLKKYASKITSIVLLTSGLYGLISTVIHTFNYTSIVTTKAGIAPEEFYAVLKKFLVEGITTTVETVYGLTMLFTKAHKLRLLHYFIAVVLFFLPFFINEQFLKQTETIIPKVQISLPVIAAETPPAQAISDYEFMLQKYRQSHTDYLSAKNTYLAFKTLNAQTEAIDKAKILLIARDDVLRTYLFAIRITLRNTPGVNPQELASLSTKLEKQELFLVSHKDTISPITGLPEISTASLAMETKYPEIQTLGYQALYAVIVGQQASASSTLLDQLDQLTNLTSEATNDDFDTAKANQWLTDTKSTLDKLQPDRVETQALLAKIKPEKSALMSNQRQFAKILDLLDTSRNRLIQVTEFLKETIKLIKYG